MTSLLSHISAFEYWRHVGTPGFATPEPSRTTIAPPNFAVSDFDWLVNTSVLSRPLHGLTSIKHKRSNEPAVRHVAYQELPFGSVCSISPEQRIASPELTIIQIAPLLSFPSSFASSASFADSSPSTNHSKIPSSSARRSQASRKSPPFASAQKGSPESRKRPRRQNMPTIARVRPWKPRPFSCSPYPSNGEDILFRAPSSIVKSR